jgi:hypothetical protein
MRRSQKEITYFSMVEPGVIEFVADAANNPEDWYVKEHGGGVMIFEPKVFVRLFASDTANYEDLEFVSKAVG